jgi:AcrR family transcriptional regulator
MTGGRQLTERQAERRQRVLVAATELGAEGGYDGVQMRSVSKRAEVALGTIYRYFTSKDQLLAAALLEWVEALEVAVIRRPAEGTSDLDRVLDLLRRATGAMAANEAASAALIGGLVSGGDDVVEVQSSLHEVFSRILETAFDGSLPAEDRRRVIRCLEHVWFSGLIAWKNGWWPIEQAISELEDAACFLLRRPN